MICIRFHVCHCHPTISCLVSLKFRIMVYLPGADSFMLLWKRSRLTDVIVLNTLCGIWRRKHRQTDRNRHTHRMDCFTWLHNGVQLQSDQFLVSNGFDDWTEAFLRHVIAAESVLLCIYATVDHVYTTGVRAACLIRETRLMHPLFSLACHTGGTNKK